MKLKEKNTSYEIPDSAIQRMARAILPGIQKYFESEEGRREFTEWQAKQGKM